MYFLRLLLVLSSFIFRSFFVYYSLLQLLRKIQEKGDFVMNMII